MLSSPDCISSNLHIFLSMRWCSFGPDMVKASSFSGTTFRLDRGQILCRSVPDIRFKKPPEMPTAKQPLTMSFEDACAAMYVSLKL